jgi:hypothetical protein
MANAAEQMGSVAEMGFHVAEKLQEAQETVDVKMGEVGIDKLEADAHAAIGKATTPEQMQDIQRGFEEQAQEAVNSQKNPKVSRALQFYGAHKSIGIQDLATVRQAKVTTENDLAANDMLGTKYSGDYVLAAAAGGDTTMAENDERILLASSVNHGTMTQEQADAHYDKWLKASKMDTIGALANSPKAEDRQRVIKMLRGSGDASTNFTVGAKPKGMVEEGNLPIWNRPTVQNEDGTHSSEYSTSFEQDGKEVLVPTVVDGKFLTPDGKKPAEGSAEEKAMFEAARQHYLSTGENLGKFDNPDDADAYANKLHNRGDSRPSVSGSPSDHPLVDGMNLAERNTNLRTAEKIDNELTEMAGAQNLNSVLNNMHDAFGKFPYTNNGKGDYEARENAVDDGDFLKSIGAVDSNGKPDRVMGEKLQQEVTRQRAEWEKEQSDKDQNIIAKHIPNVMKMSEAQVTALGSEGLSPRGISALEMERKRQIAEIRSSNLQERALARQEATEDSYELVARLGSQPGYLTRNDIPDLMKNNPKMKYSDALHVVEMRSAQSDPNFQSAMKIFEDAANQGAMTLSDVGEANIAMLKRAKEGITGTDLMKFASETVRPHVEKDIKNRLDQIVYPQLAMPTAAPGTAQPGFFSRIGTWAENQVITNAFPTTMKSYAKQESAARQAPDAAAPAKSTRPSGATGTAKGKDGKLHWADASGNDYGVAQ